MKRVPARDPQHGRARKAEAGVRGGAERDPYEREARQHATDRESQAGKVGGGDSPRTKRGATRCGGARRAERNGGDSPPRCPAPRAPGVGGGGSRQRLPRDHAGRYAPPGGEGDRRQGAPPPHRTPYWTPLPGSARCGNSRGPRATQKPHAGKGEARQGSVGARTMGAGGTFRNRKQERRTRLHWGVGAPAPTGAPGHGGGGSNLSARRRPDLAHEIPRAQRARCGPGGLAGPRHREGRPAPQDAGDGGGGPERAQGGRQAQQGRHR